MRSELQLRRRAVVDLFDDYEESCFEMHPPAPLLREGPGRLSLHFACAGVQSLMDIEEPDRLMLGYTRTMMRFLQFISRPRHIGIVGLGGGSIPKYCYRHLARTRISVAEISPEIIALRERFRIPRDDERFHVLCEDGVAFVRRHRAEFDVLMIDGFDDLGQPHDLCNQEFYNECRSALSADGVLVVNICDSSRSMLIARLKRTFQNQVLVMDGEDSTNTIAFAGNVRHDPQCTERDNEPAAAPLI